MNTTEANTSTRVFPTLPQYQSECYEQIFSSTRIGGGEHSHGIDINDISSRLQILLTLIKCVLLLTLVGQTSVTVTYWWLPKNFTFQPKHAKLFLIHKAFHNHFKPCSIQRKRHMPTVSITLKGKLVCTSACGHFSFYNFGLCLRQSNSVLVGG